ITLVAVHDKYKDSGTPKDNIHIELVYAIYVILILATGLLYRGLAKISRRLANWNLGLGIAWLALAPFFFMVPDGWDGIYERLIAGILLAWVSVISWGLIRLGEEG
ncbi:MAG: DUF998 domain-containing protein, partial [Bacteroidota bacterium]